MVTDWFIYNECWVYYSIFGNKDSAYSAKANITPPRAHPTTSILLRLKEKCASYSDAKVAIIDLCHHYITQNLIQEIEQDELQ